MEIFFHFTVELLDIRCLVLHCSNPFSVFAHWRLQVSTSYLWMLSIEPGLASELFRTSQITLVSLPLLKTRVTEYKKISPFKEINSIRKGPTCISNSRKVKRSLAGTETQASWKKRNCEAWFQWDSTVKPLNRAAHVEKEDCPFSQPRLS